MGQQNEPRWGLFKQGGSAGPAFLKVDILISPPTAKSTIFDDNSLVQFTIFDDNSLVQFILMIL